MVAAGVGVTLLPELAVRPPVPVSPDVVLRRFEAPVPRREVAMFWRRTSPLRTLLPGVARVIRDLPPGLVHTLPPET
jgi:LysR family hydrogen peroxide-inducible transcriptional activator